MAERAQKIARDEPLDPVAAQPARVVIIGTPDAAEAALIRHGELCALEGRFNSMGLASIASLSRPAGATLH